MVGRLLVCCVLAIAGWANPVLAQTLKRVGTIEVPGPKGQRFDYLTMDDEDHYLLSAHLGPGILYVIDVRTNAGQGHSGRSRDHRSRVRSGTPQGLHVGLG